jgi:dolichol-phosphate mannosyltransferase
MSNPNRPKVLAIIPVYRDMVRLEKVLRNFTEKYVDSICLVIDGSDKNEEDRSYPTPADIPVKVLRNEKRKGIGHAIRQGIIYGLHNNFDYIVVLAGNNKDSPTEIPRLLKPIADEDYDYVQGSRFLDGGKRVNNPFFRGIFSRFYPFVWTMLTDVPCTDVTNGFRAYKSSILDDQRINLDQKWLDSYELEYYIHYKVLTLGYKMKEVPVSKTYPHNHKGGYSQISPLKDWWNIVRPLVYLKLKIRK